MEKPITRTTFLHDIGLFVENLKTIHSSAYRSGDFGPIQVQGVSEFIENDRFR